MNDRGGVGGREIGGRGRRRGNSLSDLCSSFNLSTSVTAGESIAAYDNYILFKLYYSKTLSSSCQIYRPRVGNRVWVANKVNVRQYNLEAR